MEGIPIAWVVVSALVLFVAMLGLIVTLGKQLFKISRWSAAVDSDRENWRELASKIERKIDQIESRLFDLFGIISRPPRFVTEQNSPTTLSDLGVAVSECIGAKALAAELALQVIHEMRGLDSYSVQQECLRHVTESFEPSEEQTRVFRECAYENGITVSEVFTVLGLELREAVFAARDR